MYKQNCAMLWCCRAVLGEGFRRAGGKDAFWWGNVAKLYSVKQCGELVRELSCEIVARWCDVLHLAHAHMYDRHEITPSVEGWTFFELFAWLSDRLHVSESLQTLVILMSWWRHRQLVISWLLLQIDVTIGLSVPLLCQLQLGLLSFSENFLRGHCFLWKENLPSSVEKKILAALCIFGCRKEKLKSFEYTNNMISQDIGTIAKRKKFSIIN